MNRTGLMVAFLVAFCTLCIGASAPVHAFEEVVPVPVQDTSIFMYQNNVIEMRGVVFHPGYKSLLLRAGFSSPVWLAVSDVQPLILSDSFCGALVLAGLANQSLDISIRDCKVETPTFATPTFPQHPTGSVSVENAIERSTVGETAVDWALSLDSGGNLVVQLHYPYGKMQINLPKTHVVRVFHPDFVCDDTSCRLEKAHETLVWFDGTSWVFEDDADLQEDLRQIPADILEVSPVPDYYQLGGK